MLKDEFEKKIIVDGIDLKKHNVVIGRVSNVPLTLGCFFEDNEWKIYKTGERQNVVIINTGSEDEVFEKIYRIVKGKIKETQFI